MILQVFVAFSALASSVLLPSTGLDIDEDSLRWLVTMYSALVVGLMYSVALSRGVELGADNGIYYFLGGALITLPAYEKAILLLGYGYAVVRSNISG